MTLTPLIDAPLQIQIHAAAALLAVLLGPVALYRRRRDRWHKIAGYVWIAAMLVVATTSWFISSFAIIGPFSPIHGFAVLTYVSIWLGMRHVIAGRITAHRAVFRSLYWNGLLIAGLANFLPGRSMSRMVFGAGSGLGWWVIGAGAIALTARMLWARRPTPRKQARPLAAGGGIG